MLPNSLFRYALCDYMARELKIYLRQLNRTGEAVMVNDTKEAVGIVQIRPRHSRHGGAEV